MKLITLNAWGGKLYEPLMDFVKKYSTDVDIFCFQDVLFGSKPETSPIQKARLNLFDELAKALPDFNSFIYRCSNESYIHSEQLAPDIGCGRAIFVKKGITVLDNGGFKSHENVGDMLGGKTQWVKVVGEDGERLTILNLHGLWKHNSMKKDIPERIEQSTQIKEFFDSAGGKKILSGDFNIIKDGEAMKILEEGMRNLIKEYNIPSTRNKYYPKEEKFADYILVSPDVKVNDFRTLPEDVSDHLALMIDFQ